MKNRFKQIRQHRDINMSQEAFGKRLGVTGAAISRMESGNREPSEQIILSICREFNVNEAWLRTGEGEMFNQTSNTLAGQLAREHGLDGLGRQIMSAYLELSEHDRVAVGRLIDNILKQRTTPTALVEVEDAPGIPVKAPQEMTDAELHAELDRQLSEEKKQAENGSVSGHENSEKAAE